MPDAVPFRRIVGWNDEADPILVLLHEDGADERRMLSVGRDLCRGAPRIAYRGGVLDGRGWRFLASPGAIALEEVEMGAIDALSEDLETLLRSRRARLREVIGVGLGGGADALALLMCRHPQSFVAAVVACPERSWRVLGRSEPRIEGREVLVLAREGRIAPAAQVSDLLTSHGAIAFTQTLPGGVARLAAVAGNWLKQRLSGARYEDER